MEEFTPSSNRAIVPSLAGEKEISFEYKPREEGIWEILIGGKKAVITQKDLFSLVFYAANSDQIEKMTPIEQTEMRCYVRKHTIKLLKDMKKGDTLVARCQVNVPVIVEQGLKGILGKKKKSGLILPR